MKLSEATSGRVLRSMGINAPNIPNVTALAAELRIMLMRNIDSSIKYGAVAAAIKSSITVSIAAYSAVIRCDTIRPSIYASIGYGGSIDLAEVYNYGSVLKKTDAYFFKKGTGGFYLRDKEGFRVHDAGHFLEKTAREFMGKHPECTVTVI